MYAVGELNFCLHVSPSPRRRPRKVVCKYMVWFCRAEFQFVFLFLFALSCVCPCSRVGSAVIKTHTDNISFSAKTDLTLLLTKQYLGNA